MGSWGLLDRLAATGCPPVALRMIFDVGPFALNARSPTPTADAVGSALVAPSWTSCSWMLRSTRSAELREGFIVEELVWDSGHVVGLKGRTRNGGAVEECARVVIGADGVHSLVAKPFARRVVARPSFATSITALQRFRCGRPRAVCPRLPGRGVLPDSRWPDAHRGGLAERPLSGDRTDIEGHVGKSTSPTKRRRSTAVRKA